MFFFRLEPNLSSNRHHAHQLQRSISPQRIPSRRRSTSRPKISRHTPYPNCFEQAVAAAAAAKAGGPHEDELFAASLCFMEEFKYYTPHVAAAGVQSPQFHHQHPLLQPPQQSRGLQQQVRASCFRGTNENTKRATTDVFVYSLGLREKFRFSPQLQKYSVQI